MVMQACMYALPEEMHGYIGMFYGYVRARVCRVEWR
jgi:hypothetical protein